MAINAELKATDIDRLASTIDTKAGELEAQSNQIRQSVARADEFKGSAANNYDQFLNEWSIHQGKMIEAMHGAARLLHNLAQNVDALDQGAFNIH